MFQATSETIVNVSLYVEATSCPTIFGKRFFQWYWVLTYFFLCCLI